MESCLSQLPSPVVITIELGQVAPPLRPRVWVNPPIGGFWDSLMVQPLDGVCRFNGCSIDLFRHAYQPERILFIAPRANNPSSDAANVVFMARKTDRHPASEANTPSEDFPSSTEAPPTRRTLNHRLALILRHYGPSEPRNSCSSLGRTAPDSRSTGTARSSSRPR